jgi:nicotinate-nucleotide--dimethylbenzimidazole phosphoribosyltransferase
VTGRGTGIDFDALARKTTLIERALEVNRPDPSDPLDCLSKVGGLEIAGICGMILQASSMKVPVVVDGFISGAGAMVAGAMCPNVRGYLFAGHSSVEQGHRVQMEFLGLRPILDLDMRLGEGTGAALAMGIIEAGLKIYAQMATFDQASVSPGSEAEDMQ